MDYIKNLIAALFTGLAAYLSPLSGELSSLLAVFLLNFFVGLLAGLIINKESWNFKKAFRCILEATAFLLLICAIYYIGEHKGNPQGALQCVSFVTYSVFYFYGVNILRNLKNLFPNASLGYKVSAFLYYVASVEFVKKIPYLTAYLSNGKEAQK